MTWGGNPRQSASTLAMLVATFGAAVVFRGNVLVVGISAAAIGGFFHEIVQSGGSVAYPQPKEDGVYLGSVSGLAFGAIAGLLAAQGLGPNALVSIPFVSQMFFAGLALKGVAEAAGGQAKH